MQYCYMIVFTHMNITPSPHTGFKHILKAITSNELPDSLISLSLQELVTRLDLNYTKQIYLHCIFIILFYHTFNLPG